MGSFIKNIKDSELFKDLIKKESQMLRSSKSVDFINDTSKHTSIGELHSKTQEKVKKGGSLTTARLQIAQVPQKKPPQE